MRTGRYRLRKGFGNTAVLQAEFDGPSLIAGHVDSSIRQRYWGDVAFDSLSDIRVHPADDCPAQVREQEKP